MKKYTTQARPPPKNEIWEQEIDGKTFICERPYYKNKKLEVELYTKGIENECNMIFGRIVPFFFDKNGVWWACPELASQGMLKLFIKEPMLYFNTISHKIQTVKRAIQTLREIEPNLYSDDAITLIENFKKISDCTVQYYSYQFITYIVFDELVLEFKNLLDKFLPINESNVYFSEFLGAEITKEAIKVGAIGESTKNTRDIFYSDSKPIIFYREPKLFFQSDYDKKVIEKLQNSNHSKEFINKFFALRLIAPISIQISEEAQYIESKTLLPMFKIVLENIKKVLVKNNLFDQEKEIRDLSKKEILEKLEMLR